MSSVGVIMTFLLFWLLLSGATWYSSTHGVPWWIGVGFALSALLAIVLAYMVGLMLYGIYERKKHPKMVGLSTRAKVIILFVFTLTWIITFVSGARLLSR